MIFRTPYNESEFRKEYPKKYEKVNNKKLVEVAGYIPAKQRIENLMLAGMRLATFRSELYDFQAGEPLDENFTDPTRSPNFDLADAFQISNALEQKKKNVKEQKNTGPNEPVKSEPADKSPKVDDIK